MKRTTTKKLCAGMTAVALTGVLGCATDPPSTLLLPTEAPVKISDDPTKAIPEKPGAYSGGEDNTFDHMAGLGADGARDPFQVLAERQEEGPPEIRTRLHSCQKVQYTAVRTTLESFGVNIDATGDPPTAGQLWKAGGGALGVANYDARVGETLVWSASGAAKLFDIFVQAAPEIIANISAAPQCQIDGVGPDMFDAENRCVADAVTCLIGRPASPEHLAVCDSIVESGSDIDTGKKIAVATLLSAAHSCE
jgi:hypothetical protein